MSHNGGAIAPCSLLNFLEENNSKFYDLVRQLCVTRLFNPKRGKPDEETGITLLCPDDKVTDQLIALAEADDINAVNHIKMLLIPEKCDTLSELKDATTLLRKKIPIDSIDGKKASLAGGKCKLSFDPVKFGSRAQGRIQVFALSGDVIPIDGPDVENEQKKAVPKKKKGGADLSSLKSRGSLFDEALKCYASAKSAMPTDDMKSSPASQRNVPMEVLCSLYCHFKEKNSDIANCILSLTSDDALTSLYILLRPGSQNSCYIDDASYMEWANSNSNTFHYFCMTNPVSCIKNAQSADFKNVVNDVVNVQQNLVESILKPGCAEKLRSAYVELKSKLSDDPQVKLRACLSVEQLAAETELRILAATHMENAKMFGLFYEDLSMFYQKFTLDAPVHILRPVTNLSNQVFMSLYYMAARSDGFFFVPGLDYKYGISDCVNKETNQMVQLTKGIFDLDSENAAYQQFNDELAKWQQLNKS
jgi:hypothetical protein